MRFESGRLRCRDTGPSLAHVDPEGVPDVERPDPPLLRQDLDAAGECRVAALHGRPLERREEGRGAEEASGIEGVVALDSLPDPPQDAVLCLDLRRVADVHQRIAEVAVDGQPHRALLERLGLERHEQALVDQVIGHQQHEGLREGALGLQDRQPVSGRLPLRVDDGLEADAPPHGEIVQKLPEPLAVVAGDDRELGEAGVLGRQDHPLDQRNPEQTQPGLGGAPACQPAAAPRGEDQALPDTTHLARPR
jgi:hypothetical protein